VKTLIQSGLIIDGSGNEPYIGDVLIVDDKISAIGKLPTNAKENAININANGRVVTPGFVDIHRHADYAVFRDNFGAIELAQGITTAITGSCGLTPYPYSPDMADTLSPVLGEKPHFLVLDSFAAYEDALSSQPLPINIGGMIGSCSIRAGVKGLDSTAFTKQEIEIAKHITDDGMAAGALGISLGIMYKPECYSTVQEMAEVSRVAAQYGGTLTAHIRGEGDSLVQSVQEVIDIAQRADLPLQISHFKCCGTENWGKGIYSAIEVINNARKNHQIGVDFYPYAGGATSLLSLLPPEFPRNLWADASALKSALLLKYENWDNYVMSLGFERIVLNSLAKFIDYNGKNVAEICADSGECPYSVISKVLVGEEGRAGVIVMSMSSEDVDIVAKLPYASVISDALYPQNIQTAHPRTFSAFPKIIRDFVLGRQVLTIQEAIKKMTMLPAQALNIRNRGLLKPGYFADVNIFSPENLKDNSNFTQSGLLAQGVEDVIVNGKLAWTNGQVCGNYGVTIKNM